MIPWDSIGSGLSKFAGSAGGQALIGAGLGYGADRLTGGKGKVGAALGGLAGFGNSAFGGHTGNFSDSFLGQGMNSLGISGQPGAQGKLGDYNKYLEGLTPAQSAGMSPAQTGALQSNYEALLANTKPNSFMSGLSGYADTAGKYMDPASKGFGMYTQYKDTEKKGELADAEINQMNQYNAMNKAEYEDAIRRRKATGANANTAFANSSLANYGR